MPELPEVETTLRGIEPHIQGKKIIKVVIRYPRLRWPIPRSLPKLLTGKKIKNLERRGKYLLLHVEEGALIIHLGMSGSLRILKQFSEAQKHDHFELEFANGMILRLTDPRRFGAVLWTDQEIVEHPLLKHLGPEPLDKIFSANYLLLAAKKSHVPIKSFLMNSKIVVGVGNIYATEALYLAKINPLKLAKNISAKEFNDLVKAVKSVLRQAIKQGGTTLKDFLHSEGKPGYFIHFLQAYGRSGLPCKRCKTLLESIQINQRTTVFCPQCQK